MATVKITRDLLQRVNKQVASMCNKEVVQDAPLSRNPITTPSTYLCHLAMWGKDNLHLINEIPKGWLMHTKEVRITHKTGFTDANGEHQAVDASIEFTNQDIYRRPTHSSWSTPESLLTDEELTELDESVSGLAEFKAAIADCVKARQINDKWNTLGAEIQDFLGKCSTLNEAAKIFPAVRMYIHSDDLERLDRKTSTSAKRKDDIENIDFDSLAAAAVASKLS